MIEYAARHPINFPSEEEFNTRWKELPYYITKVLELKWEEYTYRIGGECFWNPTKEFVEQFHKEILWSKIANKKGMITANESIDVSHFDTYLEHNKASIKEIKNL